MTASRITDANPHGIHCPDCTDTPCVLCARQIAAEHGYIWDPAPAVRPGPVSLSGRHPHDRAIAEARRIAGRSAS